MNERHCEMEKLRRQFYWDHKKVLDLIGEHRPGSDLEPTVFRLFGSNPNPEKTTKIGNFEVKYSNFAKNQLSFMPARWHEELDKTKGAWSGCENWWAGYPFIAWVEMRAGDGTIGYLKLNAEVGPISDHKIRKRIIEAINVAASAKGLGRIQFPRGATDKGRLYSRFLSKNSITVNDIHDTDEMQRKLVQLVIDFEPEFELVAGVIPQFLSFSTP